MVCTMYSLSYIDDAYVGRWRAFMRMSDYRRALNDANTLINKEPLKKETDQTP